jgi:hypothetical protein
MRKHDPERKARRMRDAESVSGNYQFAAVDQSDGRRERPDIDKERSQKYCGGAE